MLRGRQALADFWNETLKFECLEICYFHMKPDILSLLSGSCMWRVWGMAEHSQSFCCASFGQLTRPVNPDMKKGSIHHILCPESHQQLSGCLWRSLSWLFFIPQDFTTNDFEAKINFYLYYNQSVMGCTCPLKLFLKGFQVKRAEKPLQSNFAQHFCIW